MAIAAQGAHAALGGSAGADKVNDAINHHRRSKAAWGRHRSLERPTVGAWVVAINVIGESIEDVKLPESVEDAAAEKSKIAASSLRQWLKEKEKYYLSRKLEDLGGNISLTAQSCRIGVRTLSRKMRTYGLDKRIFKEKPLGEKPAAPPRERTVPVPKSGPA